MSRPVASICGGPTDKHTARLSPVRRTNWQGAASAARGHRCRQLTFTLCSASRSSWSPLSTFAAPSSHLRACTGTKPVRSSSVSEHVPIVSPSLTLPQSASSTPRDCPALVQPWAGKVRCAAGVPAPASHPRRSPRPLPSAEQRAVWAGGSQPSSRLQLAYLDTQRTPAMLLSRALVFTRQAYNCSTRHPRRAVR